MASPFRSGSAFVATVLCGLAGAATIGAQPGSWRATVGAPAERPAACERTSAASADAGVPHLRVSIEEVDRLLRAGDVIVIDVREEAEYHRAHLPEAVSIPLDQLEGCVAKLQAAGLRVVTYCASAGCDRSSQAAMRLRRLGLGEVSTLDGGFPGWVASGRVVVVPPAS
jgi:rhodanese-related sulfurtransferase